MPVQDKLRKGGPRKLLSVDGGGIRGLLSIEILAEVEGILRKNLHKDDNFVLADYFDYFAGTSTGAVIATCLAWGMPIFKVRDFYVRNGEQMFDKAGLLERFRYKYKDEELAGLLKQEFQENGAPATLGSNKLKTLLMLVMRNATTDSPWPISNNPRAKYNLADRRCDPPGDCNLDIPLWQLVRASTAAPTYFPPEVVKVGRKEFVFVDGGITTYNNPAFQLFLMATVEPYNLNWEAGEDKMLLVSIGTGGSAEANANLLPSEMNLIYHAASIPSALMFAASNEQDLLCRVFGKCLAGDPLDREIGDLSGRSGPVRPKLFTYVRYNADLSRAGLNALGLHDINPPDVQKLDSIEHMADLQRVGKANAQQKVKPEHFAGFSGENSA